MDWFTEARLRSPRTQSWTLLLALIGALCILAIVAFFAARAPADFPKNTPVVIDSGMTASDVADLLAEKRVVRFGFVLYAAIIFLHEPEEIKAGAYVFHRPHSALSVAAQITADNPPLQHISLTFFEGTTVEHYARIATELLSGFDSEEFVNHARSYEGFLFPDTYYVPYTYSPEELIALLFETYDAEISPLLAENATGFTEYEVITLASLLEREGNSEESMRMIAGILFNRLALDMPLQVDASMEYVLGKPLNELTPEDLERDTPYNTYRNIGLPPTPIGNPGSAAVRAVLNPIPSDYLYYITGNDGNFYYAETYDEHLANIEAYLR